MYRCVECKAIYENQPQFCDCGNDVFEEVYVEQAEPSEEYREPAKPKKRKISDAELREMEEEARDRKKGIITISICALIAVILMFCPPYPQKKAEKIAQSAEKEAYSKLPAVEAYWDKSVPSYARAKDPYYNLPILNKRFSTISKPLHEYLQHIGSEFNRQWKSDLVSGNGEARIVFVINKDGVLEYKTLSVKSNNESLDDSVLLVLSKINSFDVPPNDYKGEKIILAFSTKDGTTKVNFPSN